MKKRMHLKISVLCFLATLLSQCTKVDIEDMGVQKTTFLQHNYIIITTKDDTSGEVEVSYSISENNGHNEVKTTKLSTPCLIGGEIVEVTYDSIVGKLSNRMVFSQLLLKRDYKEKGADFLSIKNLSSSTIEYAVIGNQPLAFYQSGDLEGFHNFGNKEEIDKDKVVSECPTPIGDNGVPVLYLLKPELLTSDYFYILLSIGKCEGGKLTSISSIHAEKIDLKVTKRSIREVMDLYKGEYNHGNVLFANYSDYDKKCPSNRGLSHLEMKLYGEILPFQTLRNSGQIWFVNTDLGMRGVDVLKTLK